MDELTEPESYELGHYIAVLRRRWLLVLAPLVVGTAVGLVLADRQDPTFQSRVEVLVQPTSASELLAIAGAGDGNQSNRSLTPTELAIMGSEGVREQVEDIVGRDLDVSISPAADDADVAVIAVEGDRRADVQDDAQTYADTYVELRRSQLSATVTAVQTELETDIGELGAQIAATDAPIADLDGQIAFAIDPAARASLENRRQELVAARDRLIARQSSQVASLDRLLLAPTSDPSFGVQVLSAATEPTKSGGAGRGGLVAAGAGVGLLLGLVLAFTREHFDDRVRTTTAFEAATGMQVVGMLPRMSRRKAPFLVSAAGDAPSPDLEAFRKLRAALQSGEEHGGGRSVLVASPGAGEGRTTTAANVAAAVAGAGRAVILVDGNLRRPRLHEVFGLPNTIGLTSVLSGAVSVADALQQVPGHPNLSVLTAGPPSTDPAALLSGTIGRATFTTLPDAAEYVIVDGPPLLPVADGVVLARLVDGVLLLARSGRTTSRELAAATDLLSQSVTVVTGGVMNGVSRDQAHLGGYADRSSARRTPPASAAPPPGAAQNEPRETALATEF